MLTVIIGLIVKKKVIIGLMKFFRIACFSYFIESSEFQRSVTRYSNTPSCSHAFISIPSMPFPCCLLLFVSYKSLAAPHFPR